MWSDWVSRMNGHMVDDAVVVLARSPDCVIHWISDSVSAAPCYECAYAWFWILTPLGSRWYLHLAATKLLEWKSCNRCTVGESQELVTEDCGAVEPKRRPRTFCIRQFEPDHYCVSIYVRQWVSIGFMPYLSGNCVIFIPDCADTMAMKFSNGRMVHNPKRPFNTN